MIYRPYLISLIIVLLLPLTTEAADIELFQTIPFLSGATDMNIENYINALYIAAISVASILVVIKLILAGVKYMFSEIVTNKEEAKADIRGALFGLILILGAVTILNTINPNLTKLDFLERASRVEIDTTSINVTVGGVSVTTGLIEARERAEACGGTFVRNNDGSFTVTCPTGTTPPATRTQLSGWPRTSITSALDVPTIMQECTDVGGMPEKIEYSAINYTVNCYSQ